MTFYREWYKGEVYRFGLEIGWDRGPFFELGCGRLLLVMGLAFKR